ncbi:MAG TPA: hypothetical protein VJW77_03520, partial [Terriglobia bacterium]|nr:hypothetical protein [Terriglobia bacterium]
MLQSAGGGIIEVENVAGGRESFRRRKSYSSEKYRLRSYVDIGIITNCQNEGGATRSFLIIAGNTNGGRYEEGFR